MAKFKAILPKRMPSPSTNELENGLNRHLRDFATKFQSEVQEYPTWKPWKSKPPTSGPRRGGRRTGAYGKGWVGSPRFTKNSVTITNSVPYAIYVAGTKQTRVMKERGWPRVKEVGERVAREVFR